jgi:hypothetical protein
VISRVLDRDPPALLAVALYGVFVAVLVGWATWQGMRRGLPWHWSARHAYGFVLFAIVGSFGWWWVDGPVEGSATLVLSTRHGITYGDLLAVPALLAAGSVAGARLVGRAVATDRKGPRARPEASSNHATRPGTRAS